MADIKIPGDFADYVTAIKESGSYALSKETIDQLEVRNGEVIGPEAAVNKARAVFCDIITEIKRKNG